LFKVHRYMTELIAALKQTNALSQATLIQRASRNDQSILANLSEWDGTTPPYFSMLLIRGKSQQRASAANGMVYIVGGGPGDPALITVKGLDCLRQADVVLYDRLIAPELLDEAPSSAERINVGKESKLHRRSQSEINALLIEKAREGKTVVRLKGGDPFVFGRGGEECQALAEAGLRYEVVPGISSAIAVPAYAGIPVTYRGVTTAFAVVAGHTVGEDSKIDWRSVSRIGTIVFVMGVERLPEIVSQLVAHERPLDTPAAVIEEGTTQDQRVAIGTLADIVEKSQNARPPAILIVGEVVRLREQLNWFG
jgi:uroporphyrin-III C-methyltransferase